MFEAIMENRWVVSLILLNFAIGIYAGLLFQDLVLTVKQANTEVPFDNLLTGSTVLHSPYDRIPEESIRVYSDKIVIDVPDKRQVSWSTYADTGSMLPTFGQGCNGLEFIPKSPLEIHEGDLLAYRLGNSLIIHRVIKTSIDEIGWFAITKGDNNPVADPKKVRFDDDLRVTFGLVC